MARTPARLPSGARISDHVTLGMLTKTVLAGLIDAAPADTGRQSRHQRPSLTPGLSMSAFGGPAVCRIPPTANATVST